MQSEAGQGVRVRSRAATCLWLAVSRRAAFAVAVLTGLCAAACGGRQAPVLAPVIETRPDGAPCAVDSSWESAPDVIGERPMDDPLRQRYCRAEEGSGAVPPEPLPQR